MPHASRRQPSRVDGGGPRVEALDMTSPSGLQVQPVGPALAGPLLDFFRAHSRGCFCRWWHHEGDDLSWQGLCTIEPEQNERAAETALKTEHPSAKGVVACEGPDVVGWLKLAPSPVLAKLYGRRLYRTLSCFDGDRTRTWAIGCMLVHPERRREGIARALVRGALEMARAEGAVAVEATPRRPIDPQGREHEIWMGPAALFDELGFTRIDDGPDAYPVFRHPIEAP